MHLAKQWQVVCLRLLPLYQAQSAAAVTQMYNRQVCYASKLYKVLTWLPRLAGDCPRCFILQKKQISNRENTLSGPYLKKETQLRWCLSSE